MTAPLRTDDLDDAEPVRGPGHRFPSTTARYVERNRLIVEASEMFFAGASMLDAANRLHRALDLYSNGGWRHEREAEDCPVRHIGRINGHCWAILKMVERVPGVDMLRKIIHSQRDRLECGLEEHPADGGD